MLDNARQCVYIVPIGTFEIERKHMDTTLSKTVFFRCTPEMYRQLEAIADKSVAKNISDHIRFALEQYIQRHFVELPSNEPVSFS